MIDFSDNTELAKRINATSAKVVARASALLDRGPSYLRAPALDKLAKSLRQDEKAAKSFWAKYFEPLFICPVSRSKIRELNAQAKAASDAADTASELAAKADAMAAQSWAMKP